MNGYPEGLLGALGINPEDLRRQSTTQGLLSAGLQMLAASGPSPVRQSLGQIVAQGGLAGMQGMQQAEESAIDRALKNMQIQESVRKRNLEERQIKARETALGQISSALGGGEGAAQPGLAELSPQQFARLITNPNLTKDDVAALSKAYEALKPRSQDLGPAEALYAQSKYGTANVARLTPDQAADVLAFSRLPTIEQQIALGRFEFETGRTIPRSGQPPSVAQGQPIIPSQQAQPATPAQPPAETPRQAPIARVNPNVGQGLSPKDRLTLRTELERSMPRVTDSAQSALFSLKDTADIANKLLQDEAALDAISASGMLSGLVTQFATTRPGTKAFEANALLENLQARNFVSEIQQMRQDSPTGGAVGSVAVQEMQSLSSIPAALKAGASKEFIKDQLRQLVRRSNEAQNKIISAYERDYTSASALRKALEQRSVIQTPQGEVPEGVTVRRKN